MQLTLTAIAFITIVFLSIFIMKTKAKRERRAIVGLIFLSSSSVLIALALKSMYSLVFYALQIVLLVMAISLALKEQKKQAKKSLMLKILTTFNTTSQMVPNRYPFPKNGHVCLFIF